MCFLRCILILFLSLFVRKVFLQTPDCQDIDKIRIKAGESVDSTKYFVISGCIEDGKLPVDTIIKIYCNNTQTIINKLGTMYVRNMQKLESFSIYNCPLTTIEPRAFMNVPILKEIILRNENSGSVGVSRQLRHNVFNVIPSLTRIAIQLGLIYIEDEAFSNLPNLTFVDLSNNKLVYISSSWFINSPNIQNLHLSRNNLRDIQSGIFQLLPKLKYLNLCCNQITTISESAFDGLDELKILNLRLNKISHLSSDVLPVSLPTTFGAILLEDNDINYFSEAILERTVKNYVRLIVHGNPLFCSCLDYVLNWMSENEINPSLFRFQRTEAVCVSDNNNPKKCQMNVNPLLTAYFKNKVPFYFCNLDVKNSKCDFQEIELLERY